MIQEVHTYRPHKHKAKLKDMYNLSTKINTILIINSPNLNISFSFDTILRLERDWKLNSKILLNKIMPQGLYI